MQHVSPLAPTLLPCVHGGWKWSVGELCTGVPAAMHLRRTLVHQMGSTGPSRLSRRMLVGMLVMLVLRILTTAFGLLASAWVMAVPLYYVFTLDLPGIEALSRLLARGSLFQSVVFLLAQFILLPLGLVVSWREPWRRIQSHVWRGGIAGLALGMWASTVFLSVPYLGGYANLPTGALALLVTGGPNTGPEFYFTVLAGNALFYPLIGVLILKKEKRSGRVLDSHGPTH